VEDPLDTFPRLLLQHAQARPNAPATREKDLGIWQTWTWSQVASEVRALACGLAAQGFRRGMHLAIIGDNRPRLYWSMIAAQALGGIPVPMYQDAPAAEFAFVLNDAEIVYAVAEDQEQVDKMLEARPNVPTLAHIYYDDPRGLRNYDGIVSLDRLQELGVSQRAVQMERDGWILMQSVAPNQAAVWIADKRDAIGDPEFRAIYVEYDAAFDWSPDDPRLHALVDRAQRWLAKRQGGSDGHEQAVPDPAIVQLIATSGGASSPAWDRLSEIAQQRRAQG